VICPLLLSVPVYFIPYYSSLLVRIYLLTAKINNVFRFSIRAS